MLLRTYWIAVGIGFAVQLPASLLLFHFHFPPPIRGSGGKVAAVFLIIVGFALLRIVGQQVFGKTSEDLKSILLEPGAVARQQRSALVGATAFESCGSLLLLHSFCCLALSPAIFSSPAEVAGSQFLWLALGELSSDLMQAFRQSRMAERAARKAEQNREWERVWSHLNELRVTLVCANGDSILVESETCVEAIFASANEEAITALFSGGTSLEQIRRAIWLASAANYRRPKAGPISNFGQITAPKFARLLRTETETPRDLSWRERPRC